MAFTKVLNATRLNWIRTLFAALQEKGGDQTGVAWINPGGGSNEFGRILNPIDRSPLAELMMGSSNFFQWGNWNITPYGWNESAFVMDDWKVNDKLTIQMGLRWDHDGGRSARFASRKSQPACTT